MEGFLYWLLDKVKLIIILIIRVVMMVFIIEIIVMIIRIIINIVIKKEKVLYDCEKLKD